MRPIGLYHIHHPPTAEGEQPRCVARMGGTYAIGGLLDATYLPPTLEGAERALEDLRARAEAYLDARGREPVEALPARGDIGRSRRVLPWTRPELELERITAELEDMLPEDPQRTAAELVHGLEALAVQRGTEAGDDYTPEALALQIVARKLQAFVRLHALVERVRVHRQSYEERRR